MSKRSRPLPWGGERVLSIETGFKAAALDERRLVPSSRRARRNEKRRARFSALPLLGLALTLGLSALAALYSISISTVSIDADEAVTGIMAHRILTGQQQYTFFTSQTYNGSIEQYLQALLYALTRLPENPFTLRLVQVAFCVVTTFVVFLVGRIVLERPWAAVLGAALFAAGPFYRIFLGTRSYGAYDTTQLVSLLAVYFALRAGGYVKNRARVEPGRWFVAVMLGLVGLCLGLTVWSGLSGLEILVPVCVWLIPTIVRSWRGVLLGIVGALLGAAPVLAWTFHHHSIPGAGGHQPETTFLQRAGILFGFVARQFVGLSVGTAAQFSREITLAVLGGLALVIVVAIVVRWKGLLGVVTFRRVPRRAGDLILLILPVGVLIYLVSTHSWYRGNPRYLFMLYPVAALGFAMTLHAIWQFRKAVAWRTVVALASVLVVVSEVGIAQAQVTESLAGDRGFTTDADLTAAARYLAAHDMKNAYTEYWGAVPLQYFAEDSVTIAPWGIGGGKSGSSRPAVDAAPKFVYLSTHRNRLPIEEQLRAALDAHDVSYREIHLAGDVTIFANLSKELRPAQLGLRN